MLGLTPADNRRGMSKDSEPSATTQAAFKRLRRIWLALVMVIVLVFGWLKLKPKPLTAPEHFGDVPTFALTDQTGAAFGTDQLNGTLWVSNFIFTRCRTVCPVFSAKMAELRERAQGEFPELHLVSFSVDPDYDTPEVLATYAKQFDANPSQWHFLTGPIDQVRAVVTDGMKMYMDDASTVETPEALMHGSHFVLVDADHTIRGFYNVDDETTIERLLEDIRFLNGEKR